MSSNFQNFESLNEIHAEITNRCNAACPMCARNVFGGQDTPGMDFDEWSLDEAKKVFDPRFKNLKNVLFCGTHGDPIAHSNALPLVETVKRQTKATIEFYSNGSARSKTWWADLGRLLSDRRDNGHYRKNDLGIFSVDGLSDTNALYRRRTNFEKIMENAEAFIAAGGLARWDFLVFKHNEHQVEEAEALAKKMGFKQFRIRKTSRFSYSPDGPEKYRVQNREGEIEYYLEPPTQDALKNQNKNTVLKKIVAGNDKEQVKKTQIRCLNQTEFQRIYVSAHASVLPCCFISSDLYPNSGKVQKDTLKVFDRYGWEFNSLRHRDWQEILEHPWFASQLVDSWTDADQKLLRCLRTCNVKSNPIISQTQDRPPLQDDNPPS